MAATPSSINTTSQDLQHHRYRIYASSLTGKLPASVDKTLVAETFSEQYSNTYLAAHPIAGTIQRGTMIGKQARTMA